MATMTTGSVLFASLALTIALIVPRSARASPVTLPRIALSLLEYANALLGTMTTDYLFYASPVHLYVLLVLITLCVPLATLRYTELPLQIIVSVWVPIMTTTQ